MLVLLLGFDGLGDVLRPSQQHIGGRTPISVGTGSAGPHQPDTSGGGKVLTGDLESSIASLAQNLSINKGGQASVK